MTVTATETTMIPLDEIVSNEYQSRGMGVLSRLKLLGYGLFEKASLDADKKSVIEMLRSDKPEDRKEAAKLIELHEPSVASRAESIAAYGQLEPIGVRKVKDGYDVVFGMKRVIAMLYNRAKNPKAPAVIEAKVYEGKATPVDLKLMALEENDRDDESPIDLAMTYDWLRKDGKLDFPEIAKRRRISHQTVRNYVQLLDPKIEDKRQEIHEGTYSVGRALELLKKRKSNPKEGDSRAPGTGKDNRHRLPSVKNIQKILEAKEKPKQVADKHWEFYTDDKVRQFLCTVLGFKFKPYVRELATEPTNGEAKPAAKAKTAAAKPAAEGKRPVIQITRDRADKLLIALGKMDARTWDDAKVKEKLENIPSIAEPGQKVETKPEQNLLDALQKNYAKGVQIEFVQPKK